MLLKALHFLKQLPLEAFIWLAGLVVLTTYQPNGVHFSICPFYNLGFDFCPGCGLGRSIAHLFHGEIIQSFTTHPLGIFAVIVLSFRIVQLTNLYLKSHGKNY